MSDWTQTVNDIYQQEFGRQADESGMASFTDALNQGMTGEQMREALRSSPEGQSMGAAAPIDSGGGGGALPVSDPGFYQQPNTTDWTQTVNDIYQQEFGRQADPSGMATFSNQLSQGMTGEQIRDQLRSSPEGQSYGLTPSMGGGALPTALDPSAGWEWQPEVYGENGVEAPYWRNVNTGARKEAGAVDAPRSDVVDPNGIAQHLGLNYEGTPTQFYDNSGNLKGVLVDMVGYGGNGQYILDPMSLGLALKPGEKPTINSAIQQRNENGQLLFIDPNTGETTIYNTGVPAVTGQTVKDRMYINDPGNRGGIIPADVTQGMIMLAAAMATGGVGGALLDAAGFGAGAAGGLGAGAVAGGDVGSFIAADAAASAGSAGINWGAAAATAAKTAAINAAVTAAQGGNIGDVLKAGALGAVAGGAGVAGADFLGGGTLAQIGTQTAVATAIAAASGKDPVQAAISGALSATVANLIPSGTADILNGAGITDPSIQKAINSAISSSVITAIRGGDIGTAALMGAVNSGLSSVAGMIGNSQIVQDIKANITNALTSTVEDIKYEIGATNAQALPVEGSNRANVGTALDTQTQPDVINSIFQKDAQDAMNRGLPATPPLISQATGQNDADLMAQALNNFQNNPSVGAPLASMAGATTSDVNPVALAPNRFGSSGPVSVSWYEPDTASDQQSPQTNGTYDEFGKYYSPAIPELNGYVPTTQAATQESIDQSIKDARQGLATTFGQATAAALDNTIGAVIPQVVQMASYLGLRTADQISQLAYSILGKEYTANPDAMRAISNQIAESISNPVGKAFDVMHTSGYQNEASGQVLRFISNNLDKGADYLSEKTGLPAGDIRLMTDAILMRPGTALSTIKEAGTAVKDVGRGYADAATGVVNESPTGAYNLGASVADLTRAPDTSLMRGESPTRNINLGEIIDQAPSYVSPERLSAPAPALGYSPTEVAAAPRDVASIFNDAFDAADRIPTYDVRPQSTATPATQLAPESRGALPTTFAESAIRPIDLGPNINQNTALSIVAEGRTLDQAISKGLTPELQTQAKSFIDNTYTQVADKPPSSISSAFFDNIFFSGAGSEKTTKAISDVVNNPAAPPEVILDQVNKATQDLKNLDEQLPAKLAMLSNASKLGITPAEAIKLGLLNNNGTKTELGEKVSPEPQPQPQPQPQPRPQPQPQPKPYPDPVAPLTPVKPVLPVKPPLPPIPTPPGVNPPPLGVNPVNPVVNPPVNPVNPPAVDVNPPIPTPPPLVQAAITPPAATPKASAPATTMTPSYMYGTGTQGTTIGALPGNLQSTFLQGANVNEYNPFENYNVYQQLGSPAPIRAAQGGSPLQLAQMQQGVAGIDPSLYSVLQKRQAPNYFTYGTDTSGGNPTTFAGSQLMGKPTPGIPVIPTGQKAAADWLYQGSGTNPLAMAGTGIPSLPGGMMAQGGQAENGGGEGEHIPEFVTGATGHYVRGRGDGTSDEIPAMLANNEYVFDADTVAALGNGSSDAGAAFLDKFREAVRSHKRSAPADKIPPKASPLQYVKEAMKNHGS